VAAGLTKIELYGGGEGCNQLCGNDGLWNHDEVFGQASADGGPGINRGSGESWRHATDYMASR
jgi:hypothetical protein